MALKIFSQARAQLIRRFIVPLAVGIATTVAMIFFAVRDIDNWQLFWTLEAGTYDVRLRGSQSLKPDDRIVIVDIDEKSLAEEGRWPWPRDRLATLVDKLVAAGVAVIGFDVVFAEADTGKDRELLDLLLRTNLGTDPEFVEQAKRLRLETDRDGRFAAALRDRPVVLGYFFNVGSDAESVGMLPDSGMDFEELDRRGVVVVPKATSYGANLPDLQRNAPTGGFFSTVPDPDGVLRRVPLFTVYNDRIYPSLALETARLFLGGQPPSVVLGSLGSDRLAIDRVILGDQVIRTNPVGQVLVSYRGPGKTFKYHSAADILRDRVDADRLKGKIVLVGTSAMGLLDLRATPVDPVYPGVEVHANVISSILNQDFRAETLEKIGIDVTIIAILGLLLSVLLPLLSPLLALLATGTALALVMGINLLAWRQGVVLALAAPLLTVVVIFGFSMAYGFLFESRGRRQLKSMFGQYVPPELVEEMNDDPERFSLEGESRLMTVLFADIRNFTAISESLNPRQLKDMLNRYLTPMTYIIHSHRGTIDKYVGDMVMAFWGAPLEDQEHARHGVLAAMDMIHKTRALRDEFAALGYPQITIGAGLNTGPMNVGNMGSEFRMAYTVLGDAVNLGSRLEALTKEYGVSIIVSEDTTRGIDDIAFRELDRVIVKGQTRPIKIFEPICRLGELTPDLKQELDLSARAMKLYRNREWDNAEMQFISLMQRNPGCPIYRLFVEERIPQFRANPPPADWKGEFHFLHK